MKRKILIAIAIVFVLAILTRAFLLSDFNPMFDSKSFIELRRSIVANRYRQDMDRLVDLYLKTHKIKGPISIHFSRKPGLPIESCPALDAVRQMNPQEHYGGNRLTGKFREIIFAKKIESEYANEKILKFLFAHGDYLRGNRGMRDAAKFYFDKKLPVLDEKEMITLLLMYENAALYDPYRRQEKIDMKVLEYQEFLSTIKN